MISDVIVAFNDDFDSTSRVDSRNVRVSSRVSSYTGTTPGAFQRVVSSSRLTRRRAQRIIRRSRFSERVKTVSNRTAGGLARTRNSRRESRTENVARLGGARTVDGRTEGRARGDRTRRARRCCTAVEKRQPRRRSMAKSVICSSEWSAQPLLRAADQYLQIRAAGGGRRGEGRARTAGSRHLDFTPLFCDDKIQDVRGVGSRGVASLLSSAHGQNSPLSPLRRARRRPSFLLGPRALAVGGREATCFEATTGPFDIGDSAEDVRSLARSDTHTVGPRDGRDPFRNVDGRRGGGGGLGNAIIR